MPYYDDPTNGPMKKMIEALGQAQAFNMAHSYILMEIVRDLARSTPDAQKYLASMFERVSARADQGPIEDEAHPVNAEFRDAISRFFARAGRGFGKEHG
jgi:hypothetical protein